MSKIIMTKQFNGWIERILTEYYVVLFIWYVEMVQIIKYLYPSLNKLDEITELLLV